MTIGTCLLYKYLYNVCDKVYVLAIVVLIPIQSNYTHALFTNIDLLTCDIPVGG